MILVILFGGGLLLAFSAMVVLPEILQLTLGFLGIVALIVATLTLIGNDRWHWGMRRESATSTVTLTHAQLTKLVNKSASVLTVPEFQSYYLPASTSERPLMASQRTRNHIHFQADVAPTLVTTTVTWEYTSKFWHWLFADTTEYQQIIQTDHTLTLPSNFELSNPALAPLVTPA